MGSLVSSTQSSNAIFVRPDSKLAGKEKELFDQRDEKLEAARER
jgi:hypothetical protein